MKTQKVRIFQTHKAGWKISFKSTWTKENTALRTYHLLEHRLEKRSALRLGHKTAVLVKYLSGGFNETEDSSDPGYLLWATSCFLEDFLPQQTVKNRAEKYNKDHVFKKGKK